MTRLAIALLLTAFGSSVMAENWVTLVEPQSKSKIAIDLDSVRLKTEDGRFVEVTWHFETPLPSDHDSVLDCEELSITNKVVRIQIGGKTITADYSNDKQMRYWYPEWRDAQLLRHICPRFKANWEEKWVTPLPAANCQSAKSFYEKHLCSGNREALGEYNLMIYRLVQLQSRCSITLESSIKISIFHLDQAYECKDERCLNAVMTKIFRPMEKSLQASMYGEKCTFVDDQLVEIERESRKRKALADTGDYLRCGAAAIPLLDDGISSAETVALALHSKCKPILDAALAQSDELAHLSEGMAMKLRPRLVELVLQHRVEKRQLQEIERKKSPAKTLRSESRAM